MKAAVLRALGEIEIRDVPDPACPEGGLVIAVHGCSVCGTDARVAVHGHPDLRIPQIMGHEIAGVVVERSASAPAFPVGSRVAVWSLVPCGRCAECLAGRHNFCPNIVGFGFKIPGGFAPLMAVPADAVRSGAVLAIESDLPLEQAPLFEPLACVMNGQELVRVGLQDTVAVIGAGPIGCMHLALSKLRGAGRAFVVDLVEERLRLARTFGTDLAIDATREDPVARILEETGGRGVDVVIVAASAGVAQQQALEMAAPNARVNFFAGLPKDDPFIRINSNLVHYRQLTVTGTHGSNLRQAREALELLGAGRVNGARLVSRVVPLDGVAEALARVRRGEGLKTVIRP